jgi:uncharacterized protein YkwD
MNLRFVLIATLSFFVGIAAMAAGSQCLFAQTVKGPSAGALSANEQELLTEINQARAQPRVYATYLENLRPLFSGNVYKPTAGQSFTTEEGWSAVADAINFLRAAKPLGPLTTSFGLSQAAATHVKEQSSTGSTGHMGANNSLVEQRVKAFGTWRGGIGENLSYGDESARERVLTWLIDDGVVSRGHRKRLLSNDYKVAGLSCGSHPEYGTMCVLTLAGGFTDFSTKNTSDAASAGSNKKTKSTKSKSANPNKR